MAYLQKKGSILSSVEFYDAIAPDYDKYMDQREDLTRLAVETKLNKYITGGTVLDFGGGTGSDLSWLSREYSVIFLEPAVKMRQIAREKALSANVTFIEDNIDFHNWSIHHLPFKEKPDAILMNHAVFNCIKDISLLIQSFAYISKPGTVVIAAVLRSSFAFYLREKNIKTAVRSLLGKGIVYSNYKGMAHPAYLYTNRQISRAIKPYFQLIEFSPLQDTPYKLLVFKRT